MKRLFPWMLLSAAHAQTAAPTPPAPPPPPPQLEKVEVTGQGPSDEAKRRASTASKIVIGREELLRFGDGNLADLMRRLPGVTPGGRPGRGGEIRMRGMGGGFTQILVNGERMAPGFSIDQIAPDQIERIEIQRAPTAETGARAVAGTINIVLREPLAKKLHELRVQLGGDHGEPQGNLAWTRNDSLGEAVTYSWTVVGNVQRRRDDIDIATRREVAGQPPELRTQQGGSLDQRTSLNTNARLLWRLGEGETLTLMPFAVAAQGRTESQVAQTGDPRYTQVRTTGDGTFRMLRGGGQYQKRLAEFTRLEARFGGGRTQLENHSLRLESGGTTPREQDDRTRNRDNSLQTTLKLSHQTAKEHNWVSGAELEWNQRDNTRTTLENGVPKGGTGDLGDTLSARQLRSALYSQDEWQASPHWALHGGLRFEQIDSRGDSGEGPVHNVSRVWSPLVHALWKPDPKGRDQLRMSLTRSYRAANLNDLLARRVTNSQAPSGANTEDRPDSAGNPALKPELATGLELAWEHYLPKGGLMSANLFARDIQGLIRRVLAQETVVLDGQTVQRWTQRPQNLDRARTYGLELEAKARLDELWPQAPALWVPLQLRANLSLFRSTVDGIPGPNNRIDAQPKGTANLGLDYRVPGSPWSLGANWSWTPEVLIQQSEIVQTRTSLRRVVDAYVLYTQSRDVSWRLGLSNLAPRDALSQTVIDSGGGGLLTTTDTANRTFTTWTVRAEMRF